MPLPEGMRTPTSARSLTPTRPSASTPSQAMLPESRMTSIPLVMEYQMRTGAVSPWGTGCAVVATVIGTQAVAVTMSVQQHQIGGGKWRILPSPGFGPERRAFLTGMFDAL